MFPEIWETKKSSKSTEFDKLGKVLLIEQTCPNLTNRYNVEEFCQLLKMCQNVDKLRESRIKYLLVSVYAQDMFKEMTTNIRGRKQSYDGCNSVKTD